MGLDGVDDVDLGRAAERTCQTKHTQNGVKGMATKGTVTKGMATTGMVTKAHLPN